MSVALLAGVAACGDDGGNSGGGGKVKLVVATFGEFGYKDLYAEYMKAHPDIEITERVTKAEDHHKNLAAHLATGQGAADIEAIEEGWIGQFKATPDKFVNLNDLGASEIKSQWPDWKWQTSVGKNGAQIGLGTDVGGLAMCYRTDLFAKAGLPTDRDQVSALWKDWDGYISAGKKYAAAKVPNSAFMDGPTVMYRSVLGQFDQGLYDNQDNVIVESNPSVRAAFDKTVEAINAGLSAKIAAWSADWNAGFQKGRFATIACPSWMMA
ncbi:MAG: extracellular solute-binding protein, partial [Hamadaea sp.]|nr:extracellular solute-binding protein [Hamadaea sp.]